MIGQPMVVVALAAFFSGLAALVAAVLGVLMKASDPAERMRRGLATYQRMPTPAPTGETSRVNMITRTTMDLAERLVASRGLDTVMAERLEAAGVPMRTAEWTLLHIGAGTGGGLLMLLLTAHRLAPALLGLLLGLAGPWLYLVARQGRRQAAFLAQLPDTLQLLASSLKAGYSLPQAIDTVVRQGQPPIAAEFRRAIVENQLGVPVEDALERVAERLHSDDFSWVVMAIRIQRDVGGNLAELLTTVADTLRERERLRRQVQVLSAEGRLSGIILGALPIVFGAYLLVARPTYLRPMASPLGIVMLSAAAVLLTVGGLWVAKIVRVEV